jgi:phage gpG-like protein
LERSLSVEWNGEAFAKGLSKEYAKNVELAAIHLKTRIKENLNQDQERKRWTGKRGVYYRGFDPSHPGQFPHKLRGDLQRSIAYEMSADKQTAYVGTAQNYGLFLEIGTTRMAARPWLAPTLQQESGKLAEIIRGGTK